MPTVKQNYYFKKNVYTFYPKFAFLFFFSSSNARGGNSALHLCAIHDRVECMKLLIRSGADPMLKNAMDKTALDLAQERGHHSCEELVCTIYFSGAFYLIVL